MVSKRKKIVLSLITTMVIIIATAAIGGYYYIHNILSKANKVEMKKEDLGIKEEINTKLSTEYGDIQNIALFGIDQLEGQIGRSDAIMIATIDRNNKKVKISSIMRDSYVYIPGKKEDKINHAYAFGGPSLAIRTLNENFDLNIKDFLAVNFSTLPKIIDKVGGIDINVDDEEIVHLAHCGVKGIGMRHLNGEQALAYSRIRYATGGDYRRTERQREVIEELFEKLVNKPITDYPTLLNDFMPMIKTSLEPHQILSIATDITKTGGSIEQHRFPKDNHAKGEMINDVYYLTFDKDATKQELYKWIFEDKR